MPVYATVDELTGWLGDYPPVNADVLLARASLIVDQLLVGAVYPTDVAGLPTEAATVAALRDAACAQVAWWVSAQPVPEDSRLRDTPRDATPVAGVAPRAEVAPDTVRALHVAGLLPTHPQVYG
jgi:hypothetical protein